jgi:SdpC family antimicrobial peptide
MRKSIATGSVAAVVMSAILVSLGCSAPADPGTSTPAPARAPRDGETVFRGIFFGEGDVGAQLPEMWGDDVAQQRAAITKSPELLAQQLEQAIARMKASGWSDSVVARAQEALDMVRSGQSLQDTTPVEMSTLRDLMVARMDERDPTFFSRFAADMQSGDHLRVERAMNDAQAAVRDVAETIGTSGGSGSESIVWYYGPVLVAAAAVAVAVAVVIVVFFADPAPGGHPNGLQHDELVHTLASRLKV